MLRKDLWIVAGLALALASGTAARADGKGSGSGGGSGSGSSASSGSGSSSTDDGMKSGNSGSSNNSGSSSSSGSGNSCKPDDGAKPDNANPPEAPSLTGLRRIGLQPTALGRALNAKAVAETRVRTAQQRFKVEIELGAPNHSLFLVVVDGSPVGSIQVFAREGEFEVETNDGVSLPAGLNPVSAIQRVTILDSNRNTILDASF